MKILTPGTYYGARRTELKQDGLILSEYDYLARQTDWHYHENPYFMYVLDGQLYDINQKQKTHCHGGTFLFHNWQEQHFNSLHSAAARGFHLEFDREWAARYLTDLSLWEGSRALDHPRLHRLICSIYFEFKANDSLSPVSLQLLLINLCENIQETDSREAHAPGWIARLKELLHDDPDQSLSLAALSRQLGVHPVHISRAVPKYLACTLGEYVRLMKVQKSLSYLLHSACSLTEIAYMCGFADQSHFTRVFRKYYGCTPGQIRKCL
ncbi:helix-turn-helix transcriptional regulator [Roseivirga sp. BDSF3-8]|uniref:helix-turn-helix transcriptional regulator n=1 Tax=Roseivirga sp. BDSF3-8 TaxID=3241598 RepID=UPI003532609A